MCESGVCENKCDYGAAVECPVVERMVASFSVPVNDERSAISYKANYIIHGIADGTGKAAKSFFGGGWTGNKR